MTHGEEGQIDRVHNNPHCLKRKFHIIFVSSYYVHRLPSVDQKKLKRVLSFDCESNLYVIPSSRHLTPRRPSRSTAIYYENFLKYDHLTVIIIKVNEFVARISEGATIRLENLRFQKFENRDFDFVLFLPNLSYNKQFLYSNNNMTSEVFSRYKKDLPL